MVDFILSFILPRKMVRHRDMNIFIAVLLYFACFFVAIGSSNFVGTSYIKKHEQDVLLYSELKALTDESPITLFPVEVEKTEAGTKQIKFDENIHLERITSQTVLEDKTVITLLVFYDLDYDFQKPEEHPLNFDLEGYFRHVPAENEKDMLFLVTKDYLFYIHNHGAFENGVKYFDKSQEGSVYKVDDQGKEIYYLPKDETEISVNEFGDIDTTKWTEVVTSASAKDENGEYFKFITLEDQEPEKFTAVRRLNDNPIVALRTGFMLDYASAEFYNFELNGFSGKVKDLAMEWYNFIVNVQASSIKLNNQIFGFLTIFIIPFLFIIATWLMSRKYGELTRFREYYVIAGVALVVPSLISFVLGFFMPYFSYARYFMFVQIGFYMLVIFRINSDKRLANPAKAHTDEIKLPDKLTTKPLQKKSYYDEEDSGDHKPSEID
jgi:hypothetical protein